MVIELTVAAEGIGLEGSPEFGSGMSCRSNQNLSRAYRIVDTHRKSRETIRRKGLVKFLRKGERFSRNWKGSNT